MLNPLELQKLNRTLVKKTIPIIKDSVLKEGENWYFAGIILTFPQAMVVEQQIRQAIFVFEEERPEEVIVVVLSEPAVRRYCNMLKPFSKIEVVNGERKYSYLNSVYVFVTERSAVYLVEESMSNEKYQERLIKKKSARESEFEESRKHASLNISNIGARTNQSSQSQSSQESEPDCRTSKSQKIVINRQGIKEQLVNICGTILSFYEVGRGKMNRGIGYRIEQCFSDLISEVVIWADMGCGPLKKGQRYHFKQFRIHRKPNLETSYHSHPQYSSVALLDQ